MNDATVRTFVALLPSAAQRAAVADAVGTARRGLPELDRRFRWTDPETFHLTLAFLGDVAPERLDHALEACRHAAKRRTAFRWSLAGVGAFPDERRVRVVWLGVDEGRSDVEALAEALRDELGSAGVDYDRRRFHPHLTLARSRGRPVAGTPALAVSAPSATVTSVRLMRSDLRPEGAVHTVIGTAPLPQAPRRL